MDNELKNYYGGISASMINAVIRGISLLLELGRTIGSAIRRGITGTSCNI